MSQSNFEDRLVSFCQQKINNNWHTNTQVTWATGYRNMTLLHLASALGYTKLIDVMFSWRSENSSLIIETEVDALSQDIDGFTPLVNI